MGLLFTFWDNPEVESTNNLDRLASGCLLPGARSPLARFLRTGASGESGGVRYVDMQTTGLVDV